MTKLIVGTVTSLVIVAAWQIGERMNTDALGMALGVIFGMMAGIPAALIAVTARRNEQYQPRQHELLDASTAIMGEELE